MNALTFVIKHTFYIYYKSEQFKLYYKNMSDISILQNRVVLWQYITATLQYIIFYITIKYNL